MPSSAWLAPFTTPSELEESIGFAGSTSDSSNLGCLCCDRSLGLLDS